MVSHSLREKKTLLFDSGIISHTLLCPRLLPVIRELKQRRRRRQRERHKTMGLISKNNSSARAFYVLYISLPSSAKQQREMTKFKVLWRT